MIIKNWIRNLKMSEYSKYIRSLQRNKSDDCYIKIFKNFHFLDSLCAIAKKSWELDASTRDAFHIEKQEDINQELIYINQFVLAYLANILIISGTTNYKSLSLAKFTKQEMICFCSSYFNNLSEPFTQDKNPDDFFIRINYEQFEYNICEAYCIARSIELYSHITNKLNLGLDTYFQDNTELTIDTYFKIAYIIYLLSQVFGPVFKEQEAVEMVTKHFSNISENDVKSFLKLNCSNVEHLREIDKERNKNCHRGSKYKYNFFKEFPIIKITNDKYIIPNKNIYLKQIFDIFWKFEKYIGDSFREKYFDKIFDEYTGILLKNIFEENNVTKISYNKKGKQSEFFDWCVFDAKNKIVYAFECKGYQLSIANIITGDISKQYIPKFIDKPISQMFNRIQDLESQQYSELNDLQEYEVIPIGVYYDIPFASGNIHEKRIAKILNDNSLNSKLSSSRKQISKIIKENKLEDLKHFNYYLLSIEDLELLHAAVQDNENLRNLKNILLQMKQKDTDMERFETLIFEKTEDKIIKIPYLDDIFLNFDKGIMQQIKSELEDNNS